MKRIFLFRATAIVLLSVSSLCLRSEKMATSMPAFSNIKPVNIVKDEVDEIKPPVEGLLPYYPLIIKI